MDWLRFGLRGHYGGEGYVLDVSQDDELAFWLRLHRRYSQHARLCWVCTVTQVYVSAEEFMPSFRHAVSLDARLALELDGEIVEYVEESGFGEELERMRKNAVRPPE